MKWHPPPLPQPHGTETGLSLCPHCLAVGERGAAQDVGVQMEASRPR